MPVRGTLSSSSDPLFNEASSSDTGPGGPMVDPTRGSSSASAAATTMFANGGPSRSDTTMPTRFGGPGGSGLSGSSSSSGPIGGSSSSGISSLGNASDIQIKEDVEPKMASKEVPAEIFIIPPVLTFMQMWGPTFTIFFFLGVFLFVLMWLYIYVSFHGYQDRITVLSLGNLFDQNPQARFEKYIQQTAQESMAAAMQDVTASNSNVQTAVNRLQSQLDASQTQQQGISSVLQPMVDALKKVLGSSYMPTPTTVKTIGSK